MGVKERTPLMHPARSAAKEPVGWVFTTITISVMVLLCIATYQMGNVVCNSQSKHERGLPRMEQYWAALSPYYPVEPYQPPPADCRITQVNIIQRHGARHPPPGASQRIQSVIAKLQSVQYYADASLNFLKTYRYSLGVTELMAFGGLEARRAGHEAYQRYGTITSHMHHPFIRSSSARRVVESAQNWTLGFSLASSGIHHPTVSLIIKEGRRSNNTLDHRLCPNAGRPYNYTATWTDIFATPIAARLNNQAPGADIVPRDVADLMALCALDTMANFLSSPICGLFTLEEFADYEYLGDVEKYYNTGYGEPLGPVQGVGYVNELIARLTSKPVQDNTQTNRTLDSSPVTFPLNKTMYVDFSHGNEMVAIFSAIGLFKPSSALDPRNPDPTRNWIASRFTSFGARMATMSGSSSTTLFNGWNFVAQMKTDYVTFKHLLRAKVTRGVMAAEILRSVKYNADNN